MKIAEKLKNKKLDVQYETGSHYQMTYLSDQELKWEALGELAKGEAPEGIDLITLMRLKKMFIISTGLKVMV